MRFGFDIDDTLIDLRRHAFSLYNKTFQQQLSAAVFEMIQRVEIHEPFGLTDEQGSEAWKAHLEEIYFTNCASFPHAQQILQQLVAEGHDVYYITARPKEYCARTQQWMIAQGYPIVKGHFFCGMKDAEKIATIQQLELDVYVDDKPTVLETLAAVKTMPIIRDQPYNRQGNWARLTDWQDFLKMIH